MPLKVVLKNFLNHYETLEARRKLGDDLFEAEFQSLKELTEQLKYDSEYVCTHGEKEVNRKKNRYKDILPYDLSRVVLSEYPGVPGSDYINANFVKGASGSRAYIASQGPLPTTVMDFWRMIWEWEVQVIIMACNEKESGKYKCERYWPEENDKKQYGNITVEMVKWRQVCPDFLVRTLKASDMKEERTICQFHYATWPDHGVPTTVEPIIELVRLVRDCQASEALPVLIHCSAGCGRTGTICAIDYVWGLMRVGKLTDSFSLYQIIREMRKQRIAMVQTKEQYILVHRAVAALFEQQLRIIDSHTYENIDEDGEPIIFRELKNSEKIYENVDDLIIPPDDDDLYHEEKHDEEKDVKSTLESEYMQNLKHQTFSVEQPAGKRNSEEKASPDREVRERSLSWSPEPASSGSSSFVSSGPKWGSKSSTITEDEDSQSDVCIKKDQSVINKLRREESVKHLISSFDTAVHKTSDKHDLRRNHSFQEKPSPSEVSRNSINKCNTLDSRRRVTPDDEDPKGNCSLVRNLDCQDMKKDSGGLHEMECSNVQTTNAALPEKSQPEKLVGKATVIRRPSIARLRALFEKSTSTDSDEANSTEYQKKRPSFRSQRSTDKSGQGNNDEQDIKQTDTTNRKKSKQSAPNRKPLGPSARKALWYNQERSQRSATIAGPHFSVVDHNKSVISNESTSQWYESAESDMHQINASGIQSRTQWYLDENLSQCYQDPSSELNDDAKENVFKCLGFWPQFGSTDCEDQSKESRARWYQTLPPDFSPSRSKNDKSSSDMSRNKDHSHKDDCANVEQNFHKPDKCAAPSPSAVPQFQNETKLSSLDIKDMPPELPLKKKTIQQIHNVMSSQLEASQKSKTLPALKSPSTVKPLVPSKDHIIEQRNNSEISHIESSHSTNSIMHHSMQDFQNFSEVSDRPPDLPEKKTKAGSQFQGISESTANSSKGIGIKDSGKETPSSSDSLLQRKDQYTNVNIKSKQNIDQIEKALRHAPRGAIIDLTSRKSYVTESLDPMKCATAARSEKEIIIYLQRPGYESIWEKRLSQENLTKKEFSENNDKESNVHVYNNTDTSFQCPPARAKRFQLDIKIKSSTLPSKFRTSGSSEHLSKDEKYELDKDNCESLDFDSKDGYTTFDDLSVSGTEYDTVLADSDDSSTVDDDILDEPFSVFSSSVPETSTLSDIGSKFTSKAHDLSSESKSHFVHIQNIFPETKIIDGNPLKKSSTTPSIPSSSENVKRNNKPLQGYEYIYPVHHSSSSYLPVSNNELLNINSKSPSSFPHDTLQNKPPYSVNNPPPKPPRTFDHVSSEGYALPSTQSKFDSGRLIVSVCSPKKPSAQTQGQFSTEESLYMNSINHGNFPSEGISYPFSGAQLPNDEKVDIVVDPVPHFGAVPSVPLYRTSPGGEITKAVNYQGDKGKNQSHDYENLFELGIIRQPLYVENSSNSIYTNLGSHQTKKNGKMSKHPSEYHSSENKSPILNTNPVKVLPKQCSNPKALQHSQSDASVYSVLKGPQQPRQLKKHMHHPQIVQQTSALYAKVIKPKKYAGYAHTLDASVLHKHKSVSQDKWRTQDDMDLQPSAPPRSKRQVHARLSMVEENMQMAWAVQDSLETAALSHCARSKKDDNDDNSDTDAPAVPVKVKGSVSDTISKDHGGKDSGSSGGEGNKFSGTLSKAFGRLNPFSKNNSRESSLGPDETKPASRNKERSKKQPDIAAMQKQSETPRNQEGKDPNYPQRFYKKPQDPRSSTEHWTQV